jgi:cupin fold WbuC family metalloprotein
MADQFERISDFATRSRHDITLAVTTDIIEAKSRDAKQNSRKREILALQRGNADSLQRMVNALEPGSYVRPHRHHAPPKAESVVLLAGSIGFVPFHQDGTPDFESCILLDRTRGVIALDCRESIWHTFFALEPNTVVFESKSGPFDPKTDKEFAPWAPAEGSPEAAAYLEQLVAAFQKKLPPMG